MDNPVSLPVTPATDEDAPTTARPWLVSVLVGLAALLLGGLLGYWLGHSGGPALGSVDVGFAQDMSVHHEQAVQMAALVYDRSDDPAIRSLAFDILTTQQGQMGIMSGWLDAWGRPWTSAGPRMEWMGMAVEGLMPGMATAEQMAALRAADGQAADVLFLQLMIPHHRGGIEMAQYAFDHAQEEPVRLMARGMVEAQSLEVDYMNELLVGKGQVPVPNAPAATDDHDH